VKDLEATSLAMVRAAALGAVVLVAMVSSCGAQGRCDPECPAALTCDAQLQRCVATPVDAGRRVDGGAGADAGGVGGDAGQLRDAGPPSVCGVCGLATPVCDEINRRCVRCTSAVGCFGETPLCDVSFQGGLGRCERCTADGGGCGGSTPVCDVPRSQCVGCLRNADCASGACDLLNSRCYGDGGIVIDAGVPDAGPVLPDGGPLCPVRDAGVVPCTTECGPGFTCFGGECSLNGKGADLQITLRWDSTEDLDLHVDEPTNDGGVCEIYYGARSPMCAVGSLDLDSQAGCSMDLVLIENVIYPNDGGVITPGTYQVRVDHYTSCSPIQWVPFSLEVRKGATVMGLCGVFVRNGPDWSTGGSVGAGRPVMTFTYP